MAFQLTRSNTAVSGIILSFTIPAIIFGVIAGVYVDRWDKRKVLLATNIIRAVLLVILAIFSNNLFLIYLFSFAISIATQFFIPAETPIIPLLVKKDLLLSANALFGSGIYGSVLIAYALSSPFFIFFGKIYTLSILAAFFMIAAIFINFIRVSKGNKNKSNGESVDLTIGGEIKSLFKLLSNTKEVSGSILMLTLSQVIILAIAAIGPGYANQILKISVEQFPLLFVTPAALGMVVGAVLLSTNYFHKFLKQKLATIGVFISGFSILLLPYGSKVASKPIFTALNKYLPNIVDINILHIMIFLAFTLGIANALVFVPSNTILQEETSDELRGKVYGMLNSIVGVFSLLPVIVVGGLADVIGVGKVLVGISFTLFLIGISRLVIK